MLPSGIIFGGSQVKASTVPEEVPVAQMEAIVEEEHGPIQCLAEIVTRVEQMEDVIHLRLLTVFYKWKLKNILMPPILCFNKIHSLRTMSVI